MLLFVNQGFKSIHGRSKLPGNFPIVRVRPSCLRRKTHMLESLQVFVSFLHVCRGVWHLHTYHTQQSCGCKWEARLDQSCVPAWQPLMVPSLEKNSPLRCPALRGAVGFPLSCRHSDVKHASAVNISVLDVQTVMYSLQFRDRL